MLTLSRTSRSAIRIGDDILIKILGIDNDSVRFGIAAPAEIAVNREERFKALQAAKYDEQEKTG